MTRARAVPVSCLLSVGLLAVGCGRRAEAPPPAAATSRPASSASAKRERPSPALPPAVAKPWVEVYARDCHGSITPPIVSPSAKSFVFCDAAFDAGSGRFAETARLGVLALFDDGRALRNDYTNSGLVLGPAARDAEGDEQGSRGGFPEEIAVSKDGKRVASLERLASGGVVVVRALPSLRELARTPLERVGSADSVGFVDDGDPVVVVDSDCRTTSCGKDCTRTDCASRGAHRAGAGGLSPLGGPFEGVSAMHFAASGERAVLELASGAQRVVKLPGGELVAHLADAPSGDEPASVALDARGERVAWVNAGLHVARLDAAGLTELHRDAGFSPCELAFASDGALYASCTDRVHVLREGAAPSALPMAHYPDAPVGFRAPKLRGNEQSFGKFEESSELVRPGQVARFQSDDESVDVWVFAGDPAELGTGGDLASWEHTVIARYDTDAGQVERIDGWSDLGNRSLEYAVFVRDGCDPVDRYVRVSEKGGLLYRVVVELAPGTPKKRALPLLKRFFDPLGVHPGIRRLARAPAPPRSPC